MKKCFRNIRNQLYQSTRTGFKGFYYAPMERSSRVLKHGNTKILFSFQKRSKLNLDLC